LAGKVKEIRIDGLLAMNDVLFFSYNEDAARQSETKGTRANSLYYSFPLGKDTLSFSRYHNAYRQHVGTALLPMQYSGISDYVQLSWSRLLYRKAYEGIGIMTNASTGISGSGGTKATPTEKELGEFEMPIDAMP
jgi:hemolysin activation/secretion protein